MDDDSHHTEQICRLSASALRSSPLELEWGMNQSVDSTENDTFVETLSMILHEISPTDVLKVHVVGVEREAAVFEVAFY